MKDESDNWPVPDFSNLEKPEIPDKFHLFGIDFTVKDGLPHTEEEFEDLDIPKLKKMVNESISEFKNLLRTRDQRNFEKITKLHEEMNDMINRAKLFEAKMLVQKMKNKKNESIKNLNAKIDELYNKFSKKQTYNEK
ncbi:hypothetical protein M153_1570007210 [Pseudoloma neurophilia]|uniref:Mediator of RNA polymerase II transcription subunit 7 n=1 Tax=Pseudoloma neurophilia TaxID=146866 RepID=A0A0R0LZR9_9MICR|nr:hypothetical protein M153_1570007210 [Pseudoloma neurophilia]